MTVPTPDRPHGTGLTRITADPASLVPTHLVDPELLLAGSPNDRGATLFESDDRTVKCGVWACDTYSERLPCYPEDELYVVIEGSVVVTVDGEQPQTFGPGDALVIRQGTACTLAFQGPFRKVWMTHDGTAGRSASPAVVVAPVPGDDRGTEA